MALVLGQLGYDIAEAATGLDAIDQARAVHPDLIFMDLGLPGITGDEAIARLKADPSTREIPVIVNTAFHKSSVFVERAIAFGAVEILHKPSIFHSAARNRGATSIIFGKILWRFMTTLNPLSSRILYSKRLTNTPTVNVLIELSPEHYERFIAGCDVASREYSLLQNAVAAGNKNNGERAAAPDLVRQGGRGDTSWRGHLSLSRGCSCD